MKNILCGVVCALVGIMYAILDCRTLATGMAILAAVWVLSGVIRGDE